MNIADIVVAQLRKSIMSAIPQMIPFLTSVHGDGLRKAVEVLSNLSREGSTPCFLA